MRVLIPVLSTQFADPFFVEQAVKGASVVYVLLVLDKDSPSANFGFKTSEIMAGREAVEKVKDEIRKNKRLCTDILEWGDTLEKIAQIAEMKQVDKIILHRSPANAYFENTVKDIQGRTKIPIEVVERSKL